MSKFSNFLKVAFVILILFVLPFIIMQINYRVFNNNKTEPKIAIVFGAGLIGLKPTKVLASRLDEALKLYQNKKVTKIILSGDNRIPSHNEPKAMMEYLISYGVEAQDLIPDYAGYRTADTCYRAKNVFNVQSAYIISQPFHLSRALWLCNAYGINSVTVGSSNQPFLATIYQYLREVPSSFLAFFQGIHYNSSLPGDGSEITIE